MADSASRSSWLAVWKRAVVTPATRRALPVWLGAGIVAAVLPPSDLTDLALHVPAAGAVLVATWLLLFLPTARVIVRADDARYLMSLPAPRWPRVLVGAAALVGLQLPWVALWLVGAGALGAAIVAIVTGLVVVLARHRARPPRVGALRWRGPHAALLGVYARALRRRAADALLRGAGFAVLAGIAAGLFARNNDLAPREASVLTTAVIAVVLVPGWAGALLPLVEAHRDTAWLARTSGVTERARIAVLAAAVVAVYTATSLLAAGAAIALAPAIAAWLGLVALATAVGLGLAVTRALVRADRAPAAGAVAARAVIGAIVASAIAVVALGALGASGVVAIAAVGVLAVGTA